MVLGIITYGFALLIRSNAVVTFNQICIECSQYDTTVGGMYQDVV